MLFMHFIRTFLSSSIIFSQSYYNVKGLSNFFSKFGYQNSLMVLILKLSVSMKNG